MIAASLWAPIRSLAGSYDLGEYALLAFCFAVGSMADVSQVAGTLTLAGKTVPLTLKATNFNCYFNPLFKREVCGGDFQATLRRSQWGITHGLPSDAADDVRLLVQVEAIRQ